MPIVWTNTRQHIMTTNGRDAAGAVFLYREDVIFDNTTFFISFFEFFKAFICVRFVER